MKRGGNLLNWLKRLLKRIFYIGTSYEITQEYDVKVREDGSYYYENDKGEIIDASS